MPCRGSEVGQRVSAYGEVRPRAPLRLLRSLLEERSARTHCSSGLRQLHIADMDATMRLAVILMLIPLPGLLARNLPGLHGILGDVEIVEIPAPGAANVWPFSLRAPPPPPSLDPPRPTFGEDVSNKVLLQLILELREQLQLMRIKQELLLQAMRCHMSNLTNCPSADYLEEFVRQESNNRDFKQNFGPYFQGFFPGFPNFNSNFFNPGPFGFGAPNFASPFSNFFGGQNTGNPLGYGLTNYFGGPSSPGLLQRWPLLSAMAPFPNKEGVHSNYFSSSAVMGSDGKIQGTTVTGTNDKPPVVTTFTKEPGKEPVTSVVTGEPPSPDTSDQAGALSGDAPGDVGDKVGGEMDEPAAAAYYPPYYK